MRVATDATDRALADLERQMDELQVWFAGRPCGWRDRATPGQVQQWEDREREYDALLARYLWLTGEGK